MPHRSGTSGSLVGQRLGQTLLTVPDVVVFGPTTRVTPRDVHDPLDRRLFYRRYSPNTDPQTFLCIRTP